MGRLSQVGRVGNPCREPETRGLASTTTVAAALSRTLHEEAHLQLASIGDDIGVSGLVELHVRQSRHVSPSVARQRNATRVMPSKASKPSLKVAISEMSWFSMTAA